jgi:hypothetical protein
VCEALTSPNLEEATVSRETFEGALEQKAKLEVLKAEVCALARTP